MKETYYDYLQSEPRTRATIFEKLGTSFEEVMNLPIESLRLSGSAKDALVGKTFYYEGKPVRLLTIGQLVELGNDGVYSRLHSVGVKSYQVTKYLIDLALARFALKLKGSEFTVFDIAVEDMAISDEALNWCVEHGMYELGDVYANAHKKASSITERGRKASIMNSIKAGLLKFGVVLSGKIILPGKEDPGDSVKMFPRIKSELEYYEQLGKAAEQVKQNEPDEEKKKPGPSKTKMGKCGQKTRKNSFKMGLQVLDKADFSNTTCDYSGLIRVIKLNYRNVVDFMKSSGVSLSTMHRILSGEQLGSNALAKICKANNVVVSDIVTFKNQQVVTGKNGTAIGVGDKYDLSKMFVRIRNMYGGRANFAKAAGVSVGVLNDMASGSLPKRSTMKKICKALRCGPGDIIEGLEISEESAPEVYYDYSKLKKLMAERGHSVHSLFESSGVANFSTVSKWMRFGHKMNDRTIEYITKEFGCREEDIFEVKEGPNPNHVCDYSKLLDMLSERSLTLADVVRKTGIKSLVSAINERRYLPPKNLEKVCTYLSCQPSDIMTELKSHEEVLAKKRAAHRGVARVVDYSKLFKKLEDEGMDLEGLGQKLQLGVSAISAIKAGHPVTDRVAQRISTYFVCGVEDIMTRLDGQTPSLGQASAQPQETLPPCDYSQLLKEIVQKSSGIASFLRSYKLGANNTVLITHGQILPAKTYQKLMECTKKSLDELVVFRDPKDREKVLGQLKAKQEKQKRIDQEAEADWSGLFEKLEERGMVIYDLVTKNVLTSNSIQTGIRRKKLIRWAPLKRLCEFFDCRPHDLVKRVKPRERQALTHQAKQQLVDYTPLLTLIDNSSIAFYAVCKELNVPESCMNSIKLGRPIKREYLERLCGFYGFATEELTYQLPAPKRSRGRRPVAQPWVAQNQDTTPDANSADRDISIEALSKATFEQTECDYSKLVALIGQDYRNIEEFMAATGVSRDAVARILEGRKLSGRDLIKICDTTKKLLSDIVVFRNEEVKSSDPQPALGVSDKYDFSKAFARIRDMYGSRSKFAQAAGISSNVIATMAGGRMVQKASLKKICEALRCKPSDIVVEKQPSEEGKQEVYYDYSKLKRLVEEGGQSITAFLLGIEGVSRAYITRWIRHGRKMNDDAIKAVTEALGCREEDLYEIKEGPSPVGSCDYSKLVAMLDERIISINSIGKKTGIINLGDIVREKRYLPPEKLKKLCEVLACQPSDIITEIKSREEDREERCKTHVKVAPTVDYSKLYAKLENSKITLADLGKKLCLNEKTMREIRCGHSISHYSLRKLTRYFECRAKDLLTGVDGKPLEIIEKTSVAASSEPPCDYSQLLKIVTETTTGVTQFMIDAHLKSTNGTLVASGQLLSAATYKKIMDYTNKSLDELVTFRDPKDKEAILAQFKAQEDKRKRIDQEAEADWSGLYKKLEEQGLSLYGLVLSKAVSPNTAQAIRDRKMITWDPLKKIGEFLDCKPDELVKRVKPYVCDPVKSRAKNEIVDYSPLLRLIEKGIASPYALCKEVGVPAACVRAIKTGRPIKREYLEKICGFYGFTPEELSYPLLEPKRGRSRAAAKASEQQTEAKEEQISAQEAKPQTAETAEPTSQPDSLETAGQPTTSEPKPNGQGGMRGGCNGVKFYANRFGYVKNRWHRCRRQGTSLEDAGPDMDI